MWPHLIFRTDKKFSFTASPSQPQVLGFLCPRCVFAVGSFVFLVAKRKVSHRSLQSVPVTVGATSDGKYEAGKSPTEKGNCFTSQVLFLLWEHLCTAYLILICYHTSVKERREGGTIFFFFFLFWKKVILWWWSHPTVPFRGANPVTCASF